MSITMRVSFLIFMMTISAKAEYENSCETLSSEIHLVKVLQTFFYKLLTAVSRFSPGGVHQGEGAGEDLRGRRGHEQVRGLLRVHHHALRHGQVSHFSPFQISHSCHHHHQVWVQQGLQLLP